MAEKVSSLHNNERFLNCIQLALSWICFPHLICFPPCMIWGVELCLSRVSPERNLSCNHYPEFAHSNPLEPICSASGAAHPHMVPPSTRQLPRVSIWMPGENTLLLSKLLALLHLHSAAPKSKSFSTGPTINVTEDRVPISWFWSSRLFCLWGSPAFHSIARLLQGESKIKWLKS